MNEVCNKKMILVPKTHFIEDKKNACGNRAGLNKNEVCNSMMILVPKTHLNEDKKKAKVCSMRGDFYISPRWKVNFEPLSNTENETI